LVWPTLEAYRKYVMGSQLHSRSRDRRLLRRRQAGMLECGWRLAGLDFAEVITRECDGLVREVEFVVESGAAGRVSYVVRLDQA
jgi:hypothetical protein